MKRFLVAVLLLVLSAGSTSGLKAADHYSIDPRHSFVIFKVQNRGLGYVIGRFNDISGTIHFDPDALSESSIRITVSTDSLDTGVEKRDQHLRSPDFFDVKRYPTISFESTNITALDDDRYRLTGTLTLHGRTTVFTTSFTVIGQSSELGRIGGEATIIIKRSDFGMDYQLNGGIGNEVEIRINLEGTLET